MCQRSEERVVSIIIPFYKVEKYIGDCLKSAISQTLQEIEIICIDDASPDQSRSIVLQYMEQDSRIKLIVNETNQGVSVARNQGLECAQGEYVYIMDSDDMLAHHAMEKLYEKAREKNADLILCDAYDYFSNQENKYFQNPFFYKELHDWPGHAAWWFMFKRQLIVDHPEVRFPERIHPVEDTVFSFMLFSFSKTFEYVNEPLLYYRNHSDSVMVKGVEMRDSRLFSSIVSCIDNLVLFMGKDKEYFSARKDAYRGLLLQLAQLAHDVGYNLYQFPLRQYLLILRCRIVRFVFREKTTKSGRLIIKIFKIPIWYSSKEI